MGSNERYELGLAVRRSVLGSDYVDKALSNGGAHSPDFQQLVTELGWGFVWSREEISKQTRSLITVALLTAINRPRELALHVRGAVNNGCTETEIREAVIHCVPYCGIPAAIDAMHVIDETLETT